MITSRDQVDSNRKPTDAFKITARVAGRPKDLKKTQAIIVAARAMFLEEGYEAVAMDAVAAAAGVSKMTVYSHFQDKAALFGACVRANCSDMLAGLTSLDQQAASGDVKETLNEFGSTLLRFILSAKVIAIFPRLLLSLQDDPMLARTFYEAGPERTRASLARIIEAAAGRGELVVEAPMDAADDLISLWKGDADKRALMGVEPLPSEAVIEHRARRGTNVFLRAYRP